jgi:hypothetical protein
LGALKSRLSGRRHRHAPPPSSFAERDKAIMHDNVKLVRNLESIASGKGRSSTAPPRSKSPRQLREEGMARKRQQRLKQIQDENEVGCGAVLRVCGAACVMLCVCVQGWGWGGAACGVVAPR